MTVSESDTTPIAMAAKLLHEVQRTVDQIACGVSRVPWEELSDWDKDIKIRQADRLWGKSFPDAYDFVTLAVRQAGNPCADVSDENDELVRYARMLHAIVHGVLGARDE